MSTPIVAAITGRRANSPWHGLLARSLLLLATLTLPATAQLDSNSNGMSDVWERHFNQGALFTPAQTAAVDPDGDGWTNLQESIAGTNPFSGNPPEGIVVTYVTHLNDQEEAPSVEHPDGRSIDIAVISWDTLPGKQYTLLYSTDLTNSSWLPVSYSSEGDGLPVAIAITLTDSAGDNPHRLFWRVRVNDAQADSDSDGLTDYEEYVLGTNPWMPETLQCFPDAWLATHFANLLLTGGLSSFDPNGDSDNDGSSNLDELLSGTDPNSPDSGASGGWIALQGNAAENVVLTRSREFTIPPGQTALMIVAISSEEYSYYTDPATTTDYNDNLTWNIEPAQGLAIADDVDVNDRHFDWELAELIGDTMTGMAGPVHYEIVQTISAPPGAPLAVDVEIAATNVGDETLPSTIAVAILPAEVSKVSFSGPKYHELKSDDLQITYNAPHWQLPLPPLLQRNFPIAYTRDSAPNIGGTLRIKGLPDGFIDKIRLVASDGIVIPEQNAINGGDEIALAPSTSSTAFPNAVKYYRQDDPEQAFKIQWEIKAGLNGWHRVATSAHEVYLTLEDPDTTSRQETIFHLACSNAINATTKEAALQGIWAAFEGKQIKNVKGQPLTYYANWETTHTTSAALLLNNDGECAAWVGLFEDVLQIHGIGGKLGQIRHTNYNPENQQGPVMFLNNWNTHNKAPNSHMPGFQYVNVINLVGAQPILHDHERMLWKFEYVSDTTGIAGQGITQDPKAAFSNHKVYIVDGDERLYDPSYGLIHEDENDFKESMVFAIVEFHMISEADISQDINADGQISTQKNEVGVMMRTNLANDALELDIAE